MKRYIVASCLLLFASAVFGQQVYKLISPDKSFEVSFPAKPQHDQNSGDYGPVHVEGHAYSFENSSSKFILSYVHLSPPPADLKPNDALDSAISGTAQNAGGRLLTSEPMTVQDNPGKAVTISIGENTVMDGRLVYVKPRVYQLLVLYKKGVKPAFEQQFFDSFRLSK